MPFAKHFNFSDGARGDPFLIQCSVQGNIVAGNDVRAIKRGKQEYALHKKVLPLAEDDMAKAKACEEMIMFERPDPRATQGSTQSRTGGARPVNIQIGGARSNVMGANGGTTD